ncbi:MAG: AMP-binding protein, partial [Deltaproteobacteria bacterium]|nr:AMP-binding protein [Deltaproteobacteria bacterium]
MELNLATAWEAISDEIPDSDALICGDARRSWREYEDEAARIATALATADLPLGSNVGLALYNGISYSEVQFACFKQRLTPFNVNFRYTSKEIHSLLEDADAQALFFDHSLADTIDEIRGDLPKLRMLVQVGGDSTPQWASSYDDLIAKCEPAPRIERSPDDLWMLFTGGTTGNPKGVMWPHGNIIQTMKATYTGLKRSVPQTIPEVLESVRDIAAAGRVTRQLAAAPLMHGT